MEWFSLRWTWFALTSRMLVFAGIVLLFRTAVPMPAPAVASVPPVTVNAVRPAPPMSGPSPALREVGSDADAARFLAQATFGPTLGDIAHMRQIGFRAWINEQVALPASYQVAYLDELGPGTVYQLNHGARMEAWFMHALGGQDPFNAALVHRDQLRQRVAFALSEIFVVSDQNPTLSNQPDALASYYDALTRNAFGNYRQLLEDVALHPAMGVYLSMQGNRKPDPVHNIRPDENFARESMQLFSVGLDMLNPDGTPMRDARGAKIPTYDQFTVKGFAHVYTGWNMAGCENTRFEWCWYYGHDEPAWRLPMSPYDAEHDAINSKQLLKYPGVALANGVLPAGGNARSDLKAALDNVFRHPNVGPFIGRQLIQRLVTSNPSPAYVQRVAASFDNNGAGVRGDMKAVVRAILLDSEARFPGSQPSGFGKVREPLLRLTHGWRALDARSGTGRMSEFNPDAYLSQAPLGAASVFNFFRPDYMPTGEASMLGLAAPELQLATDHVIPATQTAFGDEIFKYYFGNPDVGPDDISVDLGRDAPLAATPAALVDRYNLLFLSGQMSPAMRQLLLARLNAIANANGGRDRVQEALYFIINSPEYVVQK